jgi:hypothetical protein
MPRVIAFLLALVVAAGAACSGSAASIGPAGDVAALVDDGAPDPAGDLALALASPVIVAPHRRALRLVVAATAEPDGRLHRTSVFRPPRRVASR